MIKKLISISLISGAALMTVVIPSAQAGKYLSYNTPWTISCTGNVLGTLSLKGRVIIGSAPAGCSSSGTNTISTGTIHTPGSSAPTSWTWTMPGCFNLHKAAITGKVGQQIAYNCFANADGTGALLSTGSVTVALPVGSTLP